MIGAAGHRAEARGFTLIELLVAFMVLSLALTVLFRIFSNGLTSIELAEDYTRAVEHAENHISMTGVTSPLREGVSSGRWADGYRWHQRVTRYMPWADGDQYNTPVVAYLVTVEVSWFRRDRRRHVLLTTLKIERSSRDSA